MSHPGGPGGGRGLRAGLERYDGAILVLVVVALFAVVGLAVGVVGAGRASSSTVSYLVGEGYRGGGAVTARFDPVTGKASAVLGYGVGVVAGDGSEAVGWDTADKIAIVNLAARRVSPALRVGPDPSAMVFGPGGQRLYVADSGSAAYVGQLNPSGGPPGHTVTVIGVRANRVVATIDVCSGPTALAVSAQAHLVVVACSKQFSLIDTRTDRVVATVASPPGPNLVAVSPSGREAVVVTEAVGREGGVQRLLLLPIDLRTRRAGPPIGLGAMTPTHFAMGATSLAFRPGDNEQVWVTAGNGHGPVVYRIDLAQRRVSPPLRLDGHLVAAVHFWPNGTSGYIALSGPGEQHCLVATSLTGPVHRVRDMNPNSALWWFTPDAPYLVIPHHTKMVTVVDLTTGTARVWPLPFVPEQLTTAGT